MSKEIEIDTTDSATGLPVSKVSEVYSFWAPLMRREDGSTDACQYPFQSAVLDRDDNTGWRPLSEVSPPPPFLELLDGVDEHDTFLIPQLSIF